MQPARAIKGRLRFANYVRQRCQHFRSHHRPSGQNADPSVVITDLIQEPCIFWGADYLVSSSAI
jgi:hypothetical protein